MLTSNNNSNSSNNLYRVEARVTRRGYAHEILTCYRVYQDGREERASIEDVKAHVELHPFLLGWGGWITSTGEIHCCTD